MTPLPTTWYVYIVSCRDNTLYTGVTKDLSRRLKEHNKGKKGAKYTRARRPVELVYSEMWHSRSEACKREYWFKKLTLAEKAKIIALG